MRILFVLMLSTFIGFAQTTPMKNSIHSFTVEDINGKTFSMESLKGKKVMIVNTASKCGLTPQYKKLEALYQEYKDQNFVIVGFPANNFMWQEPAVTKTSKLFVIKTTAFLSHDG
jgi:glutathione peroxidase